MQNRAGLAGAPADGWRDHVHPVPDSMDDDAHDPEAGPAANVVHRFHPALGIRKINSIRILNEES
jgi:hypothetical protein